MNKYLRALLLLLLPSKITKMISGGVNVACL